MAKYGRGLNREIVAAINNKIINEPFDVNSVSHLVSLKGWDVPDSYVDVALANASSEAHSSTYKKYFVSLGNGKYKLVDLYRVDSYK